MGINKKAKRILIKDNTELFNDVKKNKKYDVIDVTTNYYVIKDENGRKRYLKPERVAVISEQAEPRKVGSLYVELSVKSVDKPATMAELTEETKAAARKLGVDLKQTVKQNLRVKDVHVVPLRGVVRVELTDGRVGRAKMSKQQKGALAFDPFIGFCIAYVNALAGSKTHLKNWFFNRYAPEYKAYYEAKRKVEQ